jgi:hypothetical protein
MAVPSVWMYWENPPTGRRAPYLDLCLESVRCHLDGLRLEVVDQESVFNWLPNLDREVWTRLPSATYRADYIRTRLVDRYGGLWLDFDCLVFRPLSDLVDLLESNDVVGWGREQGRFYNGLFAARAGSAMVAEWIRAQDGVLGSRDDWKALEWQALGQDVINPIARSAPFHNLAFRTVAPVMWYEWRRLLSRIESPERILKPDGRVIMLWNRFMGPILGSMSATDLKGGNILLSRLVRIALRESTVEEERSPWTKLHRLSELRFSEPGRRVEHHARRILRLPPR